MLMLKKLSPFFIGLIPIVMVVGMFLFPDNEARYKPKLGIDFVGGRQFLLKHDTDVLSKVFDEEINNFLGDKVSYQRISKDVIFINTQESDRNLKAELLNLYPELNILITDKGMSVSNINRQLTNILYTEARKNQSILNSRLNSLGVSDVKVFMVDKTDIMVELPNSYDVKTLGIVKDFITNNKKISFYAEGNEVDGLLMNYKGFGLYRSLQPIIDGEYIISATANLDQATGFPIVSVKLDTKGGLLMGRFTKNNIGKPIISVLSQSGDSVEQVVSIANVAGVFTNNFMISGLDSYDEAKKLALLLNTGSMSIPVYIESENIIKPLLGQSNLKSAIYAMIIGFVFLSIYLSLIYGKQTIRLIYLLSVNVSLIIIILGVIGANITLSTVAGLMLTIGMAIDINIIIYERCREMVNDESYTITHAFSDSFESITDSNLTTLLAAIILISISSITLKGFALCLGVGVISSYLTCFLLASKISRIGTQTC